MKVSFDFDDTLEHKYIQDYAIELLDRGIEVHIVTTRYEDVTKYKGYSHNYKTYDTLHKQLFEVAEVLGIPKENIHFTNMDWKYTFFKNNLDFKWHLDDNAKECNLLNRHTSVIGICHDGSSTWKNKCEKLLK